MQRKFFRISIIVFIVLSFALTIIVKAENEPALDSLIVSENTTAPALPSSSTTTDDTVSNSTEATVNSDVTTVRNEVGSLPITTETETNNETTDEIEDTVETTGSRVVNTTATTGESTYIPHTTVQPTQSYSTVATIPEANLSLNNILNVILIAIGVIIILLAIAIIIRLK